MAIKLIKTEAGAKSIIQRVMVGMQSPDMSLYGVVRATNAAGEDLFFAAESPKEVAAIIAKARHAGKRADLGGARPVDVLWTQDEGLTAAGESLVGQSSTTSLKTALLDPNKEGIPSA